MADASTRRLLPRARPARSASSTTSWSPFRRQTKRKRITLSSSSTGNQCGPTRLRSQFRANTEGESGVPAAECVLSPGAAHLVLLRPMRTMLILLIATTASALAAAHISSSDVVQFTADPIPAYADEHFASFTVTRVQLA